MREETLVKNLLQYKNVLEGMLTAMVGDPYAAEDLFQEVAMIVTLKRDEVPEEGFFAWTRAVCLNVVRDYRKKTKRRPVELLDEESLEALAGAFQEADLARWDWRPEALRKCAESL